MVDEQEYYHISIYANETPNRPAYIMGATGKVITYGELDLRSRKLARYLYDHGMRVGDHLAIMMDNIAEYFVVSWASQRLGLIYTPVNWHLSASEMSYIVQNCEAKTLIISERVQQLVEAFVDELPNVSVRLTTGPAFGKFLNFEEAIGSVEDDSDVDRVEGAAMFYSSGTTGRPKGVVSKGKRIAWGEKSPIVKMLTNLYGLGRDTVYLVPAPLYHAAGLAWSTNTFRAGGTVVVMDKFDAQHTLRLIETYKITHAQFVPTMFVRMLRLPEEEKAKYDLSSLKVAIHAAAPCPPEIKRQMIKWFGPIIYEYYGGSESNGVAAIDSETWLARPGTVGKPVFGKVHIVDEDGKELPHGEDGTVYFSGGSDFEYFNEPEKTRSAYTAQGWSTLGDIGHLDADGFLYLSDRRTDLILSGGVNIYPREIEDILIQHPAVLDVAVIGVPSEEFGQDVKAVVELKAGIPESTELSTEIIAFCRSRIAGYKSPKTVDFAILPRMPNGKMLKRQIREGYLQPSN